MNEDDVYTNKMEYSSRHLFVSITPMDVAIDFRPVLK